MDATTLRQVFPAFSDTGTYSDVMVNFYLSLAQSSLRQDVWGDRLDYGLALYAAHYLTLNGPKKGLGGKTVYPSGAAEGIVSSKSVSGVSKSIDTSAGRTEGGGAFNLTIYGQELLTIMSTVGFGGMQI